MAPIGLLFLVLFTTVLIFLTRMNDFKLVSNTLEVLLYITLLGLGAVPVLLALLILRGVAGHYVILVVTVILSIIGAYHPASGEMNWLFLMDGYFFKTIFIFLLALALKLTALFSRSNVKNDEEFYDEDDSFQSDHDNERDPREANF